MQCVSCQFENMPGSGRCARCGASLALATAAIDVHPPRAGRMLPLELAAARLWHRIERMGSRAATVLPAFERPDVSINFDLGTMLRCVVPGWPQLHRGDWGRASVFAISYVVLFVPGLVLCGTVLGSLLLGLAIAMHVAATCDAMVTTFATPSDRIGFTFACGLALFLAFYLPLGWMVSQVATPISINANIPPFQRGDVLWYSRVATPVQGNLVVYTLPSITAGNYIIQGQWIGRVMAVPGQTVSVENGRCLVDGKATEPPITLHPSLTDGYSTVVPEGQFFVYPDGLVATGATGAPLSSDMAERIYLVPASRVAGRLYFRSLPLSQMSTL